MAASTVNPRSIELRSGFTPRAGIRHVIFDFDGTLSLVRGGWAEIMLRMFQESVPAAPGDDPALRRSRLLNDIMSLNGQPSIQQMRLLRSRVLEHGLPALDEDAYHSDFQRRLGITRMQRIAAITSRGEDPDRYLIQGARELLRLLQGRGMVMHLVSGTEEAAVREEARHLGIDHFFEGRIHGPAATHASFSKGAEIDRIVHSHRLAAAELLSFGDGPVEIRETRRVGGMAVAVASIEAEEVADRAGIDPDKRLLLTASGADAVIGDYRHPEELLATLGFPAPASPGSTTP